MTTNGNTNDDNLFTYPNEPKDGRISNPHPRQTRKKSVWTNVDVKSRKSGSSKKIRDLPVKFMSSKGTLTVKGVRSPK